MVTTCIILNYNDSKTTIELVNKIRMYKNIDYIVVVDNASTDNSYKILMELKSEKIHIVVSNHNGGYGSGNNLGIKYSYDILNATHTIIANPDVCFSDSTVEALRNVIIKHDDVAISAAIPIKATGQKQQRPAWRLPSVFQEILSSSIVINKFIKLGTYYDDELLNRNALYPVDVVQGSMMMVDTKLMVKYGMYDEEFFLYGEEQVLAKKFKARGLRTLLITNETYIHNHSISINKSYDSVIKKRELLLKSKLLYLKKYMKINKVCYLFASIFFKLSLVELFLLLPIKNVFYKKGNFLR